MSRKEKTALKKKIKERMKALAKIPTTADWAQKKYKLIKPEYKICYKAVKWLLRRKFNKYRIRRYLHFEDMVQFIVKPYRLINYFKQRKLKRRIKQKIRIIRRMTLYSGIFASIRMYTLKKKNIWEIKNRIRFSALKFAFGSQQIRFMLYMFDSRRPSTHSTVGALLGYKHVIDTFGIYKHNSGRGKEACEADTRRTKKNMFWFKEHWRYDNVRGVLIRKQLLKPVVILTEKDKILQELAKKSTKKSKPRTKRNKIKLKESDDTIVYNKRGNPKTEPLTIKHRRRRFDTWLWFIRVMALFVRTKLYVIDKNFILHFCGVKSLYKPLYNYIFRVFKRYRISHFLLKFDMRYGGCLLKKVADIKKKKRKRLLRLESN